MKERISRHLTMFYWRLPVPRFLRWQTWRYVFSDLPWGDYYRLNAVDGAYNWRNPEYRQYVRDNLRYCWRRITCRYQSHPHGESVSSRPARDYGFEPVYHCDGCGEEV